MCLTDYAVGIAYLYCRGDDDSHFTDQHDTILRLLANCVDCIPYLGFMVSRGCSPLFLAQRKIYVHGIIESRIPIEVSGFFIFEHLITTP